MSHFLVGQVNDEGENFTPFIRGDGARGGVRLANDGGDNCLSTMRGDAHDMGGELRYVREQGGHGEKGIMHVALFLGISMDQLELVGPGADVGNWEGFGTDLQTHADFGNMTD